MVQYRFDNHFEANKAIEDNKYVIDWPKFKVKYVEVNPLSKELTLILELIED